jgi:hypothetical protein
LNPNNKIERKKHKYIVTVYDITPWLVNTHVLNHFDSVKSLFSSARPHDFDEMIGTELPVSMYTTKAAIETWHFNVPQLKEFLNI